MIPRRTTNLKGSTKLTFGRTHPNDTPCPFEDANLHTGWINTCCSLNTETAAEHLTTLGHPALAKLLSEEVTVAKTSQVATDLRHAADAFDERYVQPMDTYDDPVLGGISGAVKERFNPVLRPAFEKALSLIRQAADWYEKVGSSAKAGALVS